MQDSRTMPPTPEIDVRRLAAPELRTHLDGLAAVLADCVAGGASVSYMAPFSQADARAQFESWAVQVEDLSLIHI